MCVIHSADGNIDCLQGFLRKESREDISGRMERRIRRYMIFVLGQLVCHDELLKIFIDFDDLWLDQCVRIFLEKFTAEVTGVCPIEA